MTHDKKSFWISLLTVFVLAFVVAGNSYAKGSEEKIRPQQPNHISKKIKVVEIFWYGCSRCYSFEPHIEKWLIEKADYIKFVRIPGALGKNWLPHARAYYVAEKLNVVDKIHRPLYDAIHRDKRKLNDEQSLRAFFAEHGIEEEQFNALYNSTEIGLEIKKSYAFGQKYGIKGVPAIIIHGKYGMGAKDSGSYNKTFDVINELSSQEYEKLISDN